MKPTLGRIVIYRLTDSDADINGAREFPAIIVRVWSDTCVNLKVLLDDDQDRWATSVPFTGEYSGQPFTCGFAKRD